MDEAFREHQVLWYDSTILSASLFNIQSPFFQALCILSDAQSIPNVVILGMNDKLNTCNK